MMLGDDMMIMTRTFRGLRCTGVPSLLVQLILWEEPVGKETNTYKHRHRL